VVETRAATVQNGQPPAAENLEPKHQFVWSLRYIDSLIVRDENVDGDASCTGSADQRLFYLADANYNVTAVVAFNEQTETWHVAERYLYDPYGRVTVLNGDPAVDPDGQADPQTFPEWSVDPGPDGQSGTADDGTTSDVSNTTLYTGRELDAETGLYYYRARYYHAHLGRFLTRDPLGYAAGDENLYGYVRAAATLFLDPAGLQLVAEHWLAGDTTRDRIPSIGEGKYRDCAGKWKTLYVRAVNVTGDWLPIDSYIKVANRILRQCCIAVRTGGNLPGRAAPPGAGIAAFEETDAARILGEDGKLDVRRYGKRPGEKKYRLGRELHSLVEKQPSNVLNVYFVSRLKLRSGQPLGLTFRSAYYTHEFVLIDIGLHKSWARMGFWSVEAVGQTVAHEVGHILSDSAQHAQGPRHLMAEAYWDNTSTPMRIRRPEPRCPEEFCDLIRKSSHLVEGFVIG